MNSGSTSSDRQAPTRRRRSGCRPSTGSCRSSTRRARCTRARAGRPSGSSHGTTRWTFFQCTASMSTIRSLITGMLPIGSTTIGSPSPRLLGGVRDARVAGQRGLAVDAHAARAADRGLARAADADRGVLVVLGLQDPVEHRALGVELDARSPASGPARPTPGRSGGSSACSQVSSISTSSPPAPTGSWSPRSRRSPGVAAVARSR